MKTYTFSQYTLRPAAEEDILCATAFLSEDPFHEDMAPEFFITQGPGIESYLLEDIEGPVFFFRMTRVVRVDIQFAPESLHPNMRERIRGGLTAGFKWLMASLANSPNYQVIFESKNPELIASCIRRFRFRRSPHELVCDVAGREADNVRTTQAQ